MSLGLRVATLAFVALTIAGCGEGVIDDPLAQRNGPLAGGPAASIYPEGALVDLYDRGVRVGTCSGAVIAPKVVLTAGRCVVGASSWRVTAPFARAQTATAHRTATLNDLALVFLDTPIWLDAYPTFASRPLARGVKVVRLGRVHRSLYVSPPAPVIAGGIAGHPNDYLTARTFAQGDSGGPVMAEGTHRIVAVDSQAAGRFEVLARTDLAASWIADQVRLERGDDAVCSHDPCHAGPPLDPSCGPCIEQLCQDDGYCCRTDWDDTCVYEHGLRCGGCSRADRAASTGVISPRSSSWLASA